MKARTNGRRSQQRAAELARGHDLLARGERTEGNRAFGRAIRVTTVMARQLMRELRRLHVAFIVAPYEADAQLSFLVREGFCAAAITEDSDLLVYQCPHVIYKLEPSGHGRLTSFENLRETEHNHALLFDGSWPGEWHEWVEELFLDMCILVGTDYMKGCAFARGHGAHAP